MFLAQSVAQNNNTEETSEEPVRKLLKDLNNVIFFRANKKNCRS